VGQVEALGFAVNYPPVMFGQITS